MLYSPLDQFEISSLGAQIHAYVTDALHILYLNYNINFDKFKKTLIFWTKTSNDIKSRIKFG